MSPPQRRSLPRRAWNRAVWITRRQVQRPYLRFIRRPRLVDYQDRSEDWTPPPGEFGRLLADHDGRHVYKWVHYLPIYDELFSPFRHGMPGTDPTRPVRILEIGVLNGGSLQLWRRYFGPDATIFGIDINPDCAKLDTPENPVRIGSQADPAFLRSVVAEMGGVDVVLDDGSHVAAHQRASFDTLFPLLSQGGVYVVEDTVTSYWASYGGGYRRPGTIVEVAKGMIDGLSKWGYRMPVGRRARLASEEISSITFYDSIIAFRKQTRVRPSTRRIGERTIAE